MNYKLNFFLVYLILSTVCFAQKGVRIAYIDFNEIIEKIGDFKEATKYLERMADYWKKEIVF